MPDQSLYYAADLVAVSLLALGVYFPRHRRRDLVISYLSVNVGVLAVASALATSTVGAGLGLGLFGVLSIIRLRSNELAQHEIAYYFASLALGLLAGLASVGDTRPLVLMTMVVVVMYVAGHPRLFRHSRHQVVLLDRALTDERQLIAHLENLLGGKVHQITVQRTDLVNDTTLVDVRYEVPARRRGPAGDDLADAAALAGRTR